MSIVASTPPANARGARSIDDLLSNVSASRLSTWAQCRLKFFFRYVRGISKPKSPALHVGSSVHLVLKCWNKARWRNEQPNLKQLHDAYSSAWSQGLASDPVDWRDEKEEEQKKIGWRLLETYFRESPIKPEEKPEAVEVSVEADLSGHGLPTLIGIIDLVRPGGLIVDFKSGGKTPDAELVAHTNEIQTTAYALLYRDSTSRTEAGIELHYLVKTKNPKLVVAAIGPTTESQTNRLFRHLESYVSGLQREDWIPSPGLQCVSCEFFLECRKWH